MKPIQILAVSIILLFGTYYTKAQGCSDAGFCTIGVLKGNQSPDNVYDTRWGFNTSIGVGDGNVWIWTNSFEYNRNIGKKTFLQVKLPLVLTSGNLGSTFGLGDLSVSLSQRLFSEGHNSVDAVVGAKFATGRTSIQATGLDLPMPYQTGLGTNDLILGLSYKLTKWRFALGYQQPFGRANNTFLKENWPSNNVKDYFDSANLLRKSDLLLRAEYFTDINKKWAGSFGVLPILHLGEDEITLKNGTNSVVSGSSGLTLNINAGLNYKINDFNTLKLTLSAPLIIRDVRPDGLTRALVLGIGFEHEGALSTIFYRQKE
jgi:hypothetical protein